MKRYLLIPALMLSLQIGAAEKTNGSMPKQGEIVWNELGTTDVKKVKEFYNKAFGWEYDDKNMGDMTYTIIKKDNKEFGGIWAIPAEMQSQMQPNWLSYILVDNVEQSVEKVRQLGATVVKPVTKAGDMGLFAVIKDPTGAQIALWQPLKK